MADAGLFIGWGQVVRGREDRALEVFNETVELYGQMQSDGRIESFDLALLEPHGGELAGYAMLRGSDEQIDAVRHDEDFRRVMQRADFLVDGLGLVPALVGDGLAQGITIYQEEMAAVS
jgi:hypothetical protein